MLGVGDGEQRLVLRQRADAGVLGVPVDLAGVGAGAALVHRQDGPVVGGHPDRGDAAADLQARRVAVAGTGDGGHGVGAGAGGPRLGDPVAELVAVGVGEPPDLSAVRWQHGRVVPLRRSVTWRCSPESRSHAWISKVPVALET